MVRYVAKVKGILPITIGLAFALIWLFIMLMIIAAFLALKIHVKINIDILNGNADKSLYALNLASIPMESGKSIGERIAERSVSPLTQSEIEFISKKIMLLTGSNCFVLKDEKGTIIESGNCKKKEKSSVEIVLPYNPLRLSEKLILEWG